MSSQAPQDFLKDIGQNFQKLVKELRSQDSPEAMAYLRILGNEFGYIKAKEMEQMAQTLFMYSQDILFRLMPARVCMYVCLCMLFNTFFNSTSLGFCQRKCPMCQFIH